MKLSGFILVLLFVVSAGYAQTGDSSSADKDKKVAPWFVEKFKLTAGFFYPINNTTIRVGVTGSPGTDIDFEEDLGFKSEIGTFLASFQWRISRRSRFNLGFYNINRSATQTLAKDIVFDGKTYLANTSVNSFFNTAIYQFSYGYAIIAKPKYELGVLIGTHTIGAKAGIAVNDATVGASNSNNYGFTAPLPDLGIWGGVSLSERFAITLDLDYLSLTVNSTAGRLLAYNFVVAYKLSNPLSVSLGYTGLNFQVDKTKNEVNGFLRWGYNGPTLAATFSFGKKSWIN